MKVASVFSLKIDDKVDNLPQVGTCELADNVFGIDGIRIDIISEIIRYQTWKAKPRTCSTLTRGEVAYSTAKVLRQKGSGMARRGSISAPHLRGGAVIFGPNQGPRRKFKLNKKYMLVGLANTLSFYNLNSQMIVVDSLSFSSHKTKDAEKVISVIRSMQDLSLKPSERRYAKILFVGSADESFKMAISNIPNVRTIPDFACTTFGCSSSDIIILDLAAVSHLHNKLKSVKTIECLDSCEVTASA